MPECSLIPKSYSLLFVALLNPKFNPYLLFKFLIFYHSSNYSVANVPSVAIVLLVPIVFLVLLVLLVFPGADLERGG